MAVFFSEATGDLSINPSTGEVDLSGSVSGIYTVMNDIAASGGCAAANSSASIEVIATDDPAFTLTDYCEGGTNAATGIATVGGVFSFDPDLGDGSTVDASTGSITSGIGGTTYTLEYVTAGVCPDSSTQTVTVTTNDDPAFTLTDYCEGGTNAATGIATVGGVFSFDPDLGDGSTVDASTGSITSGIGGTTYTLEYVTAGVCPDSSTQTVTVTTNDDPAFTLTDYCEGGTNAATGIATVGGVFSFDPDLGDGSTVDASTGSITSGIGGTTYTLEYVTAGVCPDSSTQTVTTLAIDDPSFSYSSATFCLTGGNQLPTTLATAGGTFTGSAGLSINSSTGEIDVATTGIGSYDVTYTTTGSCPDDLTLTIDITASPDAAFSYASSPYCQSGIATITFGPGASGGVFSEATGDLSINPSTGEVDLSGSVSGIYTVMNDIAASGGCAAANSSASIEVIATDDPAFILTDYCEGSANSATGIATAGGVFSFNPDLGDGSTVDASTGSITSGIGGTTYTLEYVTAGACPDSSTQTVTTLAIDDPSFSYSSATFCLTGGNQLPTTLATAGGAFTGSAGLSINSSTGEIDVATTGIGSYDVTYTTTGSCPDDLTLTIDITASPDAAFSYASSPYCQSGIATITFGPGASGGVFSEATGDLSINPSTGEVDLSGSVSGIYTVMNDIAASGGCAAANSSASIEVIATDDPAFILTDYCEGSANSATGIATAGGVFSFNPDLGDGATLISSTGEILSGVGSTTYSIQYITAGICFSDTTISVTVYDSVYAGQNSTVSFCESGAIDSLFGYLGTIENSGSWSGPSILSDGFYGAFNPGSNGSGDYMYVVLSSGVCPNDTAIISVDVLNPIADFSASVTSGSAPLNVDFTNTSTDAVSYLWNTDLSTSTDLNVEEVYTTEGEYSVMLVASNGICTDTAFLIVSVFGDSELLVPNIFTPNGDGQNDLFLPISQGIDEYELLIYNRWGQLVVSIEQSNHGWDGRNSAGELVQDGTYYFVISGLGLDKQVFSETGHFLLER